jgi:single-strand DNA-binding protein
MSLNKVMLIGYVGKEPEVRYIEEGVATAVVSLATSTRGYTLPNGTVVPERTEWHRVLLWRKQAELVEKYVHTGDKLYVEGELRTRSYTDKQGRTHNVTEIWANSIELLTPKPKQQQEQTTPAAPEKCPF